ncbi:DNA binding protein [Mycobacterium phage PetterN]|nr:DNA binding protein [Mycobacterium phage PetterN]
MTTDNELEPVIRRAANSVAFQWPGIVEQEDVEQEIWARLLESESSLKKVKAMEKREQYRAIVGIGHQIASRERTDYDEYKGSYTYSVADVKSLLKRDVLTTRVDGFDAAVVDLMEGLEALARRDLELVEAGKRPTNYVEAVVSRYADGVVPRSKPEQNALSRGLEALTKAMNQSARVQFSERDDGPGTRGQVSTEDHYEGNDFDFDSFANHQGIGWG